MFFVCAVDADVSVVGLTGEVVVVSALFGVDAWVEPFDAEDSGGDAAEFIGEAFFVGFTDGGIVYESGVDGLIFANFFSDYVKAPRGAGEAFIAIGSELGGRDGELVEELVVFYVEESLVFNGDV